MESDNKTKAMQIVIIIALMIASIKVGTWLEDLVKGPVVDFSKPIHLSVLEGEPEAIQDESTYLITAGGQTAMLIKPNVDCQEVVKKLGADAVCVTGADWKRRAALSQPKPEEKKDKKEVKSSVMGDGKEIATLPDVPTQTKED